MPVLTVIDTTGIQNYIFGSNRLRENIGASEIVARATSEWIYEVIRRKSSKVGWTANLLPEQIRDGNPIWRGAFAELDKSKEIEKDELTAEVIYAGGGNTLVLFDSQQRADEFVRAYSRLLLECAPGLDVVIGHSESFDMATVNEQGQPAIIPALEKAMKEIGALKANRPLSAPLMGLGVTVECASTGGVAVGKPPDENSYLSAEALAKLRWGDRANERLRTELFNDDLKGKWKALVENSKPLFHPFAPEEEGGDFLLNHPLSFNLLGRTQGETSYIAVIHTDGNGMGQRVKNAGNQAKSNQEWITEARKFSKAIYDANLAALQETIALLLTRIEKKENEPLRVMSEHNESFELCKDDEGQPCLPLRPLIFGGEDVALVCDGRLGLALTAYYLKQAERQPLPDGQPLYTRAGVAIVKARYPFARAYALAEDLAKSAKFRIKEAKEKQGIENTSALDWHIASTGLAGDVREIRRREYEVKAGSLTARPLLLRTISAWSDGWRSWEAFEQIITEFLDPEKWRERRNKVKALQTALRGGPEVTKEFIKLYRLDELPSISNGPSAIGLVGWHGKRCGYFDAIEAIDLFFPLESATKAESGQEEQ